MSSRTRAALAVLVACLIPGTTETTPASQPVRPNIVLIVTDDMGYADIGVHGGREIPTPNIDALVRGGVQFTNGYVTAPYCSPTRAGLLTGRYQQRFGHEFNLGASARGLGPVDVDRTAVRPSTALLPAFNAKFTSAASWRDRPRSRATSACVRPSASR